jgi:hypothetical protein
MVSTSRSVPARRGLEPVQVDQQEPRGRPVPATGPQPLGEPVRQQRPVRQPGQCVVQGDVQRLVVLDVEQDPDPAQHRGEEPDQEQPGREDHRGGLGGERLQGVQVRQRSQRLLMMVRRLVVDDLLDERELRVHLIGVDLQHRGRVATVDRGEHPPGRGQVRAVSDQHPGHLLPVARVTVTPDRGQRSDQVVRRPLIAPQHVGARLQPVLALQRLLSSDSLRRIRERVRQAVRPNRALRRSTRRLGRPQREAADTQQHHHETGARHPQVWTMARTSPGVRGADRRSGTDPPHQRLHGCHHHRIDRTWTHLEDLGADGSGSATAGGR